jgi:hypothetical protein
MGCMRRIGLWSMGGDQGVWGFADLGSMPVWYGSYGWVLLSFGSWVLGSKSIRVMGMGG